MSSDFGPVSRSSRITVRGSRSTEAIVTSRRHEADSPFSAAASMRTCMSASSGPGRSSPWVEIISVRSLGLQQRSARASAAGASSITRWSICPISSLFFWSMRLISEAEDSRGSISNEMTLMRSARVGAKSSKPDRCSISVSACSGRSCACSSAMRQPSTPLAGVLSLTRPDGPMCPMATPGRRIAGVSGAGCASAATGSRGGSGAAGCGWGRCSMLARAVGAEAAPGRSRASCRRRAESRQ